MAEWNANLRPALFIVGLLAPSACSDALAPDVADPRLFVTASAGSEHTCAVTADERVLCWGRNWWGELGDGTTVDRRLPTGIATGRSFSAVSAGAYHTCALTTEGVAYCWGQNGSGILGIGTAEASFEPTPVDTETRFTSVSAGDYHTCAIDTEGKAYCWGGDYRGAVGAQAPYDCYDDVPCYLSPVEVSGDLRFENVSAGAEHTCGVSEDGGIYCWGDNEYGQLGASSSELCGADQPNARPCSTTPLRVSWGNSWEDVTAGDHHTCALAADGRVHCWGGQWLGVLGDGSDPSEDGFRAEPAPVVGNLTFAAVNAGGSRTCAVSSLGPTYCWGGGHLGSGSTGVSAVPVAVATSARFHTVTVGGTHTCGVSPEGVMYCWGDGTYGQLGDGSHALGWTTPVAVGGW